MAYVHNRKLSLEGVGSCPAINPRLVRVQEAVVEHRVRLEKRQNQRRAERRLVNSRQGRLS